MGFAEEIKSSQESKAAPQEAPAADLPKGPIPVQGEAYPGTEQPHIPSETAVPAAKIKIGDREFSSQEDALIFAREEVARAQGLTKGVEETLKASQKPVEDDGPQEDPVMKELEELMFTDPALYNKKVLELSQQRAFEQYQGLNAQQNAQLANKAAYDGYKRDFYSKNPDLSDFDAIVEDVILNPNGKYWNSVKDLPIDQAGEKVAQYTRELLKIKKNSELKHTELQNKPAVFPGATNGQGSPSKQVEYKNPVDFITQVNKHRKRV